MSLLITGEMGIRCGLHSRYLSLRNSNGAMLRLVVVVVMMYCMEEWSNGGNGRVEERPTTKSCGGAFRDLYMRQGVFFSSRKYYYYHSFDSKGNKADINVVI
jgi:hypothetical protein